MKLVDISGTKKEYLKDMIIELETYSKSITEFKKGFINLVSEW
jgi:hypothetical protein